jgi:hypothetical protein
MTSPVRTREIPDWQVDRRKRTRRAHFKVAASRHINISTFLCFLLAISMGLDTAAPQNGTIPPPFARSNTSSTSLYFDAMPSLFNGPRGQSRSSSPERGIKPTISAPIPTDPAHNSRATHINGHTNIGDGEDDKTTLRARGSTHGGGVLASEPQQLPPVQTEGAVEMNRHENGSAYDVSSPASARKRSLSRSEEHDETSLRSIPVQYTNMVPEGEDLVNGHPQAGTSRKVSVKRSPSKLVKRRGTKGKQTENLANGSIKGDGTETRRSASRTSQRSFRSSRGPVFDIVTAPPNATLGDVGGAFGSGAVMAAPEHEVDDELQSGFKERVTIAEHALTKKQTVKIKREECTLASLIFA